MSEYMECFAYSGEMKWMFLNKTGLNKQLCGALNNVTE